MFPFCWMQVTGFHLTVMLDEVTSDILTKVGGADGTGGKDKILSAF